MIGYFLIAVVSVLTCAGQLCQKQAAQISQSQASGKRISPILRWLLLAVVLLGGAMLLWLRVLQLLPLSIAYPMLSMNFVLVTLCGRWLFNEAVDYRHWIGVAAIMSGILLMSLQT